MAHGRFGASAGHAQKNTHAAIFATDLFYILLRVYNKSALLLAALDLGENLTNHLPDRCLTGSRFSCPAATWLMIYFVRTGVPEKNALSHHTLCTDDGIIGYGL